MQVWNKFVNVSAPILTEKGRGGIKINIFAFFGCGCDTALGKVEER